MLALVNDGMILSEFKIVTLTFSNVFNSEDKEEKRFIEKDSLDERKKTTVSLW